LDKSTEDERDMMHELLQNAVGAGQTFIIDSGNDEVCWKADTS